MRYCHQDSWELSRYRNRNGACNYPTDNLVVGPEDSQVAHAGDVGHCFVRERVPHTTKKCGTAFYCGLSMMRALAGICRE